jgi:hypothetical protein
MPSGGSVSSVEPLNGQGGGQVSSAALTLC